MFQNAVKDIFKSAASSVVLRILCRNRTGYSGRGLAAEAGINHQVCINELKRLSDAGILNASGQGKNRLYSLNEKSAVVQNIVMPVFQAEAQLVLQMGEYVFRACGRGVESVVLFGSTARDDAEDRGDIDVLIITRDEKSAKEAEIKSAEITPEVSGMFGGIFSPVVMAAEKFRKGYKKKQQLSVNIVREGRVIAGKGLAEVLGEH